MPKEYKKISNNYQFQIITNFKFRFSAGQSLIEVVVSVGIAVILAVSLITTSLISQKSARIAKRNTQATKIAQETTEQVRVFRDRKGFEALPKTLCYKLSRKSPDDVFTWEFLPVVCADKDTWQPVDSDKVTFFQKIEFNGKDDDNKLVTVSIGWDEPEGFKFVSSQTILSRW